MFDNKNRNLTTAGLTGGIATGKSTVASIFAEAGASIVDADEIAHHVVRQGQPAWRKIVEHFGKETLLADGEIDRQYLGNIIFNDPGRKQVLNRIVHPFVFMEMAQRLEQVEKETPGGLVILDVPLLIETGMHRWMSEVIVVYIPESVQISRLMARDGISKADALARIRSQLPIDEKKELASIVIDNRFDIGQTRKRTMEVLEYLRGIPSRQAGAAGN